VSASRLYLLRKTLELLVKFSASPTFFLFCLELILISIAMLAFSILSLVERHVGGLAVELYVLGLAFADHDWVFEINMDDHYELPNTRLEEQVFDVRKDNVNILASERRRVSQAVLVNLDFA